MKKKMSEISYTIYDLYCSKTKAKRVLPNRYRYPVQLTKFGRRYKFVGGVKIWLTGFFISKLLCLPLFFCFSTIIKGSCLCQLSACLAPLLPSISRLDAGKVLPTFKSTIHTNALSQWLLFRNVFGFRDKAKQCVASYSSVHRNQNSLK